MIGTMAQGRSVRFVRSIILVALTTLGVVAMSGSTVGAASGTPNLFTNETLTPGQFLTVGIAGQNSGYRLSLQTDGNLVVYRWNNKALWSTGTAGQAIAYLGMQGDGNLVLYRTNGTAAWSSGTFGANHRLVLQADGNLVIYNAAGTAVWNTGTWENLHGGNLSTWCGFDANRAANVRVRKVANNGTPNNNRARLVADFGAWYWNAAGTAAPAFQVVEPTPSPPQPTAEIVTIVSNLGPGSFANATGSNTAGCPLQVGSGSLTLQINSSILDLDAEQRHVGPHEFGHYLGLSHYPDNAFTPPPPYNTFDPVANPGHCTYIPLMWPRGDHGAECSRFSPVGVDLLRVPRIYD